MNVWIKGEWDAKPSSTDEPVRSGHDGWRMMEIITNIKNVHLKKNMDCGNRLYHWATVENASAIHKNSLLHLKLNKNEFNRLADIMMGLEEDVVEPEPVDNNIDGLEV